jgi:hypothetical protein
MTDSLGSKILVMLFCPKATGWPRTGIIKRQEISDRKILRLMEVPPFAAQTTLGSKRWDLVGFCKDDSSSNRAQNANCRCGFGPSGFRTWSPVAHTRICFKNDWAVANPRQYLDSLFFMLKISLPVKDVYYTMASQTCKKNVDAGVWFTTIDKLSCFCNNVGRRLNPFPKPI